MKFVINRFNALNPIFVEYNSSSKTLAIEHVSQKTIVTVIDKTTFLHLDVNLNQIEFNVRNTILEVLFYFYREINLITDKNGNETDRVKFFQRENLWATNRLLPIEVLIQSQNTTHPKRPTYQEGEILYKRFHFELNADIEFKIINRATDLEFFYEWHNQERVAYFWELNKSKDELYEYLTNGLSDPHQIPVVAYINNNPVGYFEIYWTKEDRLGPIYNPGSYDRGFHLLIGNKEFLGFKNTDALLKSVVHFIFLDCPATTKIMGEPRHDNQKILKYVETFKAWRKIKTFDFPHKRAVLLECDKELFFTGNYL